MRRLKRHARNVDVRSEEPASYVIGRPEWWFVGMWTAVLLAATAVPIVHGFLSAPPNWSFTGFVGAYHNDYHSYLAWMRQARDGHLLFRDLFTAEPHGRVFFHPLFWLMGTSSRVLHVPLLAVWYTVQALANALLVFTLYRFCAHFVASRFTRCLALVLATTAAGLGWLTNPVNTTPWTERSIDLWLAEANGLRGLVTSFFTLPLALSLLLLAMLHVLRYYREQRRKDLILGVLFALALGVTHQYDMVTLYGVLGVYALFAPRRRLASVAIVAAISLPSCLYSLGVILLDPIFSLHRASVMDSPTVASYVLGWGLPLFAAVIAVVTPAIRRTGRDVGFLAVFLGVVFVILALPIGFQRKLSWGLHPPMCLLAAMLVAPLVEKAVGHASSSLAKKSIWGVALVGFSALCAVGSLVFYLDLLERNAKLVAGDYQPEEFRAAFAYLESHGDVDDVVLATTPIASMIPGRTGKTVFAGHWAQTKDYRAKSAFVWQLFGGVAGESKAAMLATLRENRVRFLVLDRVGRGGVLPEETPPILQGLATPVLQNAFVRIWSLSL
jgi:hypothetical protein